jgi:hypothetical protein
LIYTFIGKSVGPHHPLTAWVCNFSHAQQGQLLSMCGEGTVGIGGMSISVARMVDLIDCTEMDHSFDALCSRRSFMPAKSAFSTGPVRRTVQTDGRTLLLLRHWGGPDKASLSDRGIPALIGASCQQSSPKAARCVWSLTNSTFSDLCFGKRQQPVFSCTENVCL